MERFISKLNEIKDQLVATTNSFNLFDNNKYNFLIERFNAIVEIKYGANNIFNLRINQLKKDSWSSVGTYDLESFKILIDIVIDDIELSHRKDEEIIAPMLLEIKNTETVEEIKILNNNIFIVHGHNETMKLSVARMIEKLGLSPVILHEKANQGQTVIEKFLTNSNVGFAIVILSADDIGYSKKQGESSAKKRARQNVIFELGYFTAKLGRKKVIALIEGSNDFELPSDIHGVIYIPYDGESGKWKFDIAKELIDSGYSINANKLM